MIVVKDISHFVRHTVGLLQNICKLKILGIETQFCTTNMTSGAIVKLFLSSLVHWHRRKAPIHLNALNLEKKMNADKSGYPILCMDMIRLLGDYFDLEIMGSFLLQIFHKSLNCLLFRMQPVRKYKQAKNILSIHKQS